MKVYDIKGLVLSSIIVFFLAAWLLARLGSYENASVISLACMIAGLTILLIIILHRLLTVQALGRKILKGQRILEAVTRSNEPERSSNILGSEHAANLGNHEALREQIASLERRIEKMLQARDKDVRNDEDWLLDSRQAVQALRNHSSQLAAQAKEGQQLLADTSNVAVKETTTTLRMLHQRLIEAERRVISAFETSSLDHSDQLRSLSECIIQAKLEHDVQGQESATEHEAPD